MSSLPPPPLWPPPPPPARWPPMASISSMKTMHGAFFLACSKRSRTREAPTPTNISTNSEPEAEMKGTPASPATARASSVLPVPGGPYMMAPRGILAPSAEYLAGFLRKSTTSVSSCLEPSQPATSSKVTPVFGSFWICDLDLPALAASPSAAAAAPGWAHAAAAAAATGAAGCSLVLPEVGEVGAARISSAENHKASSRFAAAASLDAEEADVKAASTEMDGALASLQKWRAGREADRKALEMKLEAEYLPPKLALDLDRTALAARTEEALSSARGARGRVEALLKAPRAEAPSANLPVFRRDGDAFREAADAELRELEANLARLQALHGDLEAWSDDDDDEEAKG